MRANRSSSSRAITTCSPSRSCSTSPRGYVSSATGRAPTVLRAACHRAAAVAAQALAGAAATRGIPARHRAARSGRDRRGRVRPRALVDRSARRCTGRSTSSATFTVAMTSSWRCSARWGMSKRDDGRRTAIPKAGRRSSSATSSTVDRRPRRCSRPPWQMVGAGSAICVPGNHENKLVRALKGRDVQRSRTGSPRRSPSSDEESDGFRQRGPRVHRRAREPLRPGRRRTGGRPCRDARGDAGSRVRAQSARSRCTGTRRERPTSSGCPFGTRGRATTAAKAAVVYGHTPVPEPEWLNNTIYVDTGCVFGGRLTALRYPERDLVSVPARATYYEPSSQSPRYAGARCR